MSEDDSVRGWVTCRRRAATVAVLCSHVRRGLGLLLPQDGAEPVHDSTLAAVEQDSARHASLRLSAPQH